MTAALVMFGVCTACQGDIPCRCEYALYGRYGITAADPGHPSSGRCGGCHAQIDGVGHRHGKFLYCRPGCVGVLRVAAKSCCGVLAGDVCDCAGFAAGIGTYTRSPLRAVS